MSDTITISGRTEIRIFWGHRPVGTLKGWTAVRASPADPGTVTATIVNLDSFVFDASGVSRRPLMFVVPHKHGTWRWPIDSLQIADGTLCARLSPQG